jgi:anti-sigma-K factor RskA
MSDEQRDLAAAAALGILSPEELARLAEESARSPEVAARLEEYRATVAMLEAGLVREAPPPGLFDEVVARIESPSAQPIEDAETSTPRPPLRRRARRFWPAFAAGAVTAAAAATVLVFALTGGGDLGSPDARAAVSGTDEFPLVHGEARLYHSSDTAGVLAVDLADVPAPPPGEHYEVWVLRTQGGGAMEAVGSFAGGDSSVDLELPLPGPGDYEAVDISVQRDGGPAAHSGTSLAGGRFKPVT